MSSSSSQSDRPPIGGSAEAGAAATDTETGAQRTTTTSRRRRLRAHKRRLEDQSYRRKLRREAAQDSERYSEEDFALSVDDGGLAASPKESAVDRERQEQIEEVAGESERYSPADYVVENGKIQPKESAVDRERQEQIEEVAGQSERYTQSDYVVKNGTIQPKESAVERERQEQIEEVAGQSELYSPADYVVKDGKIQPSDSAVDRERQERRREIAAEYESQINQQLDGEIKGVSPSDLEKQDGEYVVGNAVEEQIEKVQRDNVLETSAERAGPGVTEDDIDVTIQDGKYIGRIAGDALDEQRQRVIENLREDIASDAGDKFDPSDVAIERDGDTVQGRISDEAIADAKRRDVTADIDPSQKTRQLPDGESLLDRAIAAQQLEDQLSATPKDLVRDQLESAPSSITDSQVESAVNSIPDSVQDRAEERAVDIDIDSNDVTLTSDGPRLDTAARTEVQIQRIQNQREIETESVQETTSLSETAARLEETQGVSAETEFGSGTETSRQLARDDKIEQEIESQSDLTAGEDFSVTRGEVLFSEEIQSEIERAQAIEGLRESQGVDLATEFGSGTSGGLGPARPVPVESTSAEELNLQPPETDSNSSLQVSGKVTAPLKQRTGDADQTNITGALPDEVDQFQSSLDDAASTFRQQVVEPAADVGTLVVESANDPSVTAPRLATSAAAFTQGDTETGFSALSGDAAGLNQSLTSQFVESSFEGAGGIVNVPALASTAIEGSDIVATGISRTSRGEGVDFATDVGTEAAALSSAIAKQAAENPADFAGTITGGSVASTVTTPVRVSRMDLPRTPDAPETRTVEADISNARVTEGVAGDTPDVSVDVSRQTPETTTVRGVRLTVPTAARPLVGDRNVKGKTIAGTRGGRPTAGTPTVDLETVDPSRLGSGLSNSGPAFEPKGEFETDVITASAKEVGGGISEKAKGGTMLLRKAESITGRAARTDPRPVADVVDDVKEIPDSVDSDQLTTALADSDATIFGSGAVSAQAADFRQPGDLDIVVPDSGQAAKRISDVDGIELSPQEVKQSARSPFDIKESADFAGLEEGEIFGYARRSQEPIETESGVRLNPIGEELQRKTGASMFLRGPEVKLGPTATGGEVDIGPRPARDVTTQTRFKDVEDAAEIGRELLGPDNQAVRSFEDAFGLRQAESRPETDVETEPATGPRIFGTGERAQLELTGPTRRSRTDPFDDTEPSATRQTDDATTRPQSREISPARRRAYSDDDRYPSSIASGSQPAAVPLIPASPSPSSSPTSTDDSPWGRSVSSVPGTSSTQQTNGALYPSSQPPGQSGPGRLADYPSFGSLPSDADLVPDSPTGRPPSSPTGGTPESPSGTPPSSPIGGTPESPSGTPPSSPIGGTPDSPTGTPPSSPIGGTPDSPTGTPPSSPTGGTPDSPTGRPPSSPTGGTPDSPTGTPPSSPIGGTPDSPTGRPPSSPTGGTPDSPTGRPPSSPTGSTPGSPTGSPSPSPTGEMPGYPTGRVPGYPTTPVNSEKRRVPDYDADFEREPPSDDRPATSPYNVPFKNPIASGTQVLFGGAYPSGQQAADGPQRTLDQGLRADGQLDRRRGGRS